MGTSQIGIDVEQDRNKQVEKEPADGTTTDAMASVEHQQESEQSSEK